MEQKNFKFALKSVDETGSFQGLLSTYNNTDRVSECCMPGCFTKSIQENGGKLPLLVGHDAKRFNIGVLKLRDTPDALEVTGLLNLGLKDGADARTALLWNMQQGLRSSMSIGFQVIKDSIKGGVRYLSECKLYEGSLVVIPANPEAIVTSVKEASADPRIYGKDGNLTREEHEFIEWFEALIKRKP